MALEGTPRQLKFAARFVAYSKQKGAAAELVDVSARFDGLVGTGVRADVVVHPGQSV
jgi:hypothetical protein